MFSPTTRHRSLVLLLSTILLAAPLAAQAAPTIEETAVESTEVETPSEDALTEEEAPAEDNVAPEAEDPAEPEDTDAPPEVETPEVVPVPEEAQQEEQEEAAPPALRAAVADTVPPGRYLTTTRVNLRDGAGTSNGIVLKLAEGTPLTVRGPADGPWWEVTVKGRTGWILSTWVTAAPTSRFLTSGSINLRTGPGTSNSVLTVLPKDSPVRALGPSQGNWWQVRTEGHTGWVSISYLKAAAAVPLITSSSSNFRTGPGTGYTTTHKLPRGTPLTATGVVEGGWWQITTKGRTGWIHANYLRAAPTTGYVTTSRLNLRSGPSTSNSIVAKLPKDGAVTATGAVRGNWWQVTAQGRTGWVLISYLRSGSTAPRPKTPAAPDCRVRKCIALTFDDGPGPYTNRLLDILAAEKVPATFFLVGMRVGDYPGAVQRMQREGHEVGSHTWSHPDLTFLSDASIGLQVSQTDTAIRTVTGRTPQLLRPPYGARDSRVDRLVDKPMILWDVDTLDWEHRSPRRTVSIAVNDAREGSIVLMHDIHSTTVDAVPELITQLRARGFTFVTVTDLFAPTTLQRATPYYAAR